MIPDEVSFLRTIYRSRGEAWCALLMLYPDLPNGAAHWRWNTRNIRGDWARFCAGEGKP